MTPLLVLASTALFAPSSKPFRPPIVSLGDLDDHKSLAAALSIDGIVAIADIPNYASSRVAALNAAHACDLPASHKFADGTSRLTTAADSLDSPLDGCEHLDDARSQTLMDFRSIVAAVTETFTDALSAVVGADGPALLSDASGERPYQTVSEVVAAGQQLEHFHVYSRAASNRTTDDARATLDLHTDQGLFIAFTPALSVGGASGHHEALATLYVQRADGTTVEASLSPDTLVFMLGDGVAQFVTPNRPALTPPLRAAPHALRVHARRDGAARLWYGLMVLPPAGATLRGVTYGEFRTRAREGAREGHTPDSTRALGCGSGSPVDAAATSTSAPASASRRHLQSWSSSAEDVCGEGELYCWHRCMNLTGDALLSDGSYLAYGPDATACDADAGETLQCVNPRGQLSPGDTHGDYFPRCVTSLLNETDYPTLEGYPRDDDDDGDDEGEGGGGGGGACDAAALAAFVEASADEGYAASLNLTGSCGGGWGVAGTPCVRGALLWSLTADGVVHAKMVVDGLFGWLAFGHANPGGGHGGMDGARIALALPGTDYDPLTGLDLAGGGDGPNVAEYVINEEGGAAFRLWSTPFAAPSSLRNGRSAIEATDCFTAMAFSTDALAGWPLVSDDDDGGGTGTGTAGGASAGAYLWAFESSNSYVQYHGSESRGHLSVDWSAGAVDGLGLGAACGGVTPPTAGVAAPSCAPPLACGCTTHPSHDDDDAAAAAAAAARGRALLFGSMPHGEVVCACE